MDINKEDFEKELQEGQDLLLEYLAVNPEISPEKFYKVANFLEYINLFSGVIFSVIESGSKKKAID